MSARDKAEASPQNGERKYRVRHWIHRICHQIHFVLLSVSWALLIFLLHHDRLASLSILQLNLGFLTFSAVIRWLLKSKGSKGVATGRLGYRLQYDESEKVVKIGWLA
jgi:hypothetical protein